MNGHVRFLRLFFLLPSRGLNNTRRHIQKNEMTFASTAVDRYQNISCDKCELCVGSNAMALEPDPIHQ